MAVSATQANLDDVTFIVERVIWYLKQKPEELMAYFRANPHDALHSLDHPQRGMILCGRDAARRFSDIANRFLATKPDKKAVTDFDTFVGNLRSEFSRRFLQVGEEVTTQNIDRMISSAYKRSQRNRETLRHFIPCAIFLSRGFHEFDVGPVKFLKRTLFDSRFGREVEALRDTIAKRHQDRCADAVAKGFPADRAATPETSRKLADHLVNGVRSFFSQYEWIAVVTVGECDQKVSYDRAIWLTKSALNIIKLVIGRSHTHRLRTADDLGHAQASAKLSHDSKGEYHIQVSDTPNDNVSGDECLKLITEGSLLGYDLAVRALNSASGFAVAPHLCERFLDALWWYGDAVSERAAAARVVKFVTAIEHMTGTGPEKDTDGDERGVTEIVTTRAGILYSPVAEKPLGESIKEVSQIYDCRSNLVHGSVSPFDDDVIAQSHQAEAIARRVLIGGLHYFNEIGLDDASMTQARLRERFLQLEHNWTSIQKAANPSTSDNAGS